jgi:hypothetical protein
VLLSGRCSLGYFQNHFFHTVSFRLEIFPLKAWDIPRPFRKLTTIDWRRSHHGPHGNSKFS